MNASDIDYKSIQIEPTNRCNLSCQVCWHTLGNINKFADIEFDLAKAIIEQFDGVRDLNLQGLGEPFLAIDLLRIIYYARNEGISVWLTSNLNTDIDERFAYDIIESGLAKIRVSIDTNNENEYADIKKGGSLQKVIDNIKLINSAKDKCSSDLPVLAFNTIAMKRNIKDLKDVIILADKLRVREIALIPLVVFNKGIATNEESLNNNIHLINKYIYDITKTSQNLNIKLDVGISVTEHPKEMGLVSLKKPKCTYSCYVDCHGFFYPCCNVTYYFGNFKKSSLSEMIGNDRYIFFKNNILNNDLDCVSCMEILNKF